MIAVWTVFSALRSWLFTASAVIMRVLWRSRRRGEILGWGPALCRSVKTLWDKKGGEAWCSGCTRLSGRRLRSVVKRDTGWLEDCSLSRTPSLTAGSKELLLLPWCMEAYDCLKICCQKYAATVVDVCRDGSVLTTSKKVPVPPKKSQTCVLQHLHKPVPWKKNAVIFSIWSFDRNGCFAHKS